MNTRIPLYREVFAEPEKILLQSEDFKVSAWTYPSDVLAVSLENSRGRLVVLPYQGQMIWSAVFEGCDLTMTHLFKQPRPSPTIIDTYGCFMFHSGLLRNGCPAPDDTHALHGEMPCAPMDTAWLEIGEGFVRLGGSYEYAKGFGDRYRASPSVTLRADSALFDIDMDVTNLAGKPMELMCAHELRLCGRCAVRRAAGHAALALAHQHAGPRQADTGLECLHGAPGRASRPTGEPRRAGIVRP
jgi:hypothetical protein